MNRERTLAVLYCKRRMRSAGVGTRIIANFTIIVDSAIASFDCIVLHDKWTNLFFVK